MQFMKDKVTLYTAIFLYYSEEFTKHKCNVARQAVNSRSGRPIPTKDIEQYQQQEQRKDHDVMLVSHNYHNHIAIWIGVVKSQPASFITVQKPLSTHTACNTAAPPAQEKWGSRCRWWHHHWWCHHKGLTVKKNGWRCLARARMNIKIINETVWNVCPVWCALLRSFNTSA